MNEPVSGQGEQSHTVSHAEKLPTNQGIDCILEVYIDAGSRKGTAKGETKKEIGGGAKDEREGYAFLHGNLVHSVCAKY